MVSASTSMMPTGGSTSQSLPSSRRSSDTQRIISSFALRRPLPYGNIPLRRSSGSSSISNVTVSISPPDVNLSGIEGFDYDYDAGELIHPYLSRKLRVGKKDIITLAEGSISSPSLPISTKEESSRRELSRSSNASSRRSSVEGRMPRLLQQSISPPTTSSHTASAVGRPFLSTRGSKSLAEKGEPSVLPSLYDMSRGRSAHVSLGRRWDDRRGASASVLSGADEMEEGDIVTPKRRSRRKGVKETRKNSASSLEPSLFSSDDGLSPSSEEEESVRNASRRSSMEKDRKKELRVLLAPSRMLKAGQTSSSQPIATSPSEEGLDGSLSSVAKARSISEVSPVDWDLAISNDETDEEYNASALLTRRRSRSGRRLLDSSIGSSSSPQYRPATRLDVIQAGLTPDGLSDPLSFKTTVGSDADPLLGSDFGSVLDVVDVEAVEWDDQPKQSSSIAVNSIKTQLKKDRRQSVAEQERERRVGFAAAYQQRLAALLWLRESVATKERNSEEDKASIAGGESASLLTSSLRHLLRLPNLLLMPTLGATRSKGLTSDDATTHEVKHAVTSAKEGGLDSSTFAASLSTLASAFIPASSESASQIAAREASEFRRRGVMNPLEGDTDVSAYVSGLGLPIDPDLELSSLVHLQTFRTSYTSKSRRGSLEKPASLSETGQHRRSYSDNLIEPAFGLTLESLRSEAFERGLLATRKDKTVANNIDEEKKHRSRKEDRRASSTRGCSRPAVSAPVPGGFSAYNSSDSGEDEAERESVMIKGKQSVFLTKDGNRSRRRARTRRRSTSPPSKRKQCAVGLFDSKRRGHQIKEEEEEEEADVNMIRVRSTPNLTSLSNSKKSQKQQQQQSRHDGRGRGDSVKVVSASIASEDEQVNKEIRAVSTPRISSRSALGLGLPGSTGGRSTMVSNGAHLLMLSLELEMMRHRKITCSLKPRWLKARVRSDNFMRSGLTNTEGRVEHRNITSPSFMPVAGSSLRFEVVPST